MLLSIVFCAIGAANGLNDETLIMEFANNNILGMTVISGILTVLVLYLVFKLRKKQVKQEWKLNHFKIKNFALASVISFSSPSSVRAALNASARLSADSVITPCSSA